MNKLIKLSASTAVISGLLLATGCSSSDGGGSSVASIPANAIVIDSNNAVPTVQAAASSASLLGSASALAVETTQILNLQNALDIIRPKLKNITYNASENIATGIEFNDDCTDGGSISGTRTESDDGTNYSEIGTLSFNNCIEPGFTLNGSMSYSSSGSYSTGDYSEDASGSVTMSFNGGSESFSFTGFVFSEIGNNLNYTYTIDQLTYAIDFVINGTTGNGFLVILNSPIVESSGDACPESGHITVSGANGTTAEGIFNGDSVSMTIKANGEIVTINASCNMQP